MTNETFRSNQIPNEIQASIDEANTRADAAEARYQALRKRIEAAIGGIIGALIGALVSGTLYWYGCEMIAKHMTDQQENRLVVTTPAVETTPARECFDGDVRDCPSANALGQGPASASCHNGRWDPCTPPPSPSEIRLPPFNMPGVRVTAYDCETDAEVGVYDYQQRHRPVYFVAHSGDGALLMHLGCPRTGTQRLQEQVQTLDGRLRRIEFRRPLTASELLSPEP